MITTLFFLIPSIVAQLDLCEPAMDPSPSCLCTRLDFMDTHSYNLRFGNSNLSGSKFYITPPSFNSDYDCTTENTLQCGQASDDGNVTAFAVFNGKYILEFPSRIPSVFCHSSYRMFDMKSSAIQQFQASGELPMDVPDLHLTEVGCISYSDQEPVTLPPTTVLPSGCTCSQPPPIMTQYEFNMQYAFNFPKQTFKFQSPTFVYTTGCQKVSMVCPSSQVALMFFNNQFILSGNDIHDVATRYNLHCDSPAGKWKFDVDSENKFMELLGISSIELTQLGCAGISAKA